MIDIKPSVDVMGVTYRIEQKTEDDAMFKKYSTLSGYCDYTSKRIVYDPNDGSDADLPIKWVAETVRYGPKPDVCRDNQTSAKRQPVQNAWAAFS